jgi:hypothetical protein
VLDPDLIYFDPDRDVELAKVINDLHDYECYDMPLVICTTRVKPSLVWRSNGGYYNPFGPLPKTPEHEITFISETGINLAFSRLNN